MGISAQGCAKSYKSPKPCRYPLTPLRGSAVRIATHRVPKRHPVDTPVELYVGAVRRAVTPFELEAERHRLVVIRAAAALGDEGAGRDRLAALGHLPVQERAVGEVVVADAHLQPVREL